MNLAESITLYIAKRQAAGEKYYSPARVLRALSRSHGEIVILLLTPDLQSGSMVGLIVAPVEKRGD